LKPLLILGTTWPEPQATAAGGHMQQLINFFVQQEYQITFASTTSESDLSMDFESLGIQKQHVLLNHDSFDTFLLELKPQIVLFDRFLMEEQFGWRVAEFAPEALRILDTEDLHSLRKTRETAFKKDKRWTPQYWQQADSTKREIASIYRSDLSLIISSFEMELLQNTLKIDSDLLLHLPFLLDGITRSESDALPTFEKRADFLCIGNGKHSPNVDAIVWLKKEIWPLIKKALPETKLNIYGAYLPEYVNQMNDPKQGFLVHGWAANKEEIFKNSRINLAPLRFGAGIKGKLIDAMQAGTPSITTAVGAEGMHGALDWSGSITENAAQFAHAAIALYEDEISWATAQKNGIAIVNQLHNKKIGYDALRKKLAFLAQHLKAHRAQNFIGALVQHQTMASTKYMSKWIAAKNKKD